MQQVEVEFHPAADEFPLLDKKRLSELAGDIKVNGQREPIKLFDGKILDGRNRYLACQEIQVIPRSESLPDDIDPYLYVWSLNGERRDLPADQRYLIWKSCNEQSEEYQAEQQRIQSEANQARAEAAKQGKVGRAAASKKEETKESLEKPQVVARQKSDPKRKSSTAKATASKTNRGTVERMDRLDRERPDLAEKVRVGELKSAEALRTMNRDKNKEKIEEITQNNADDFNKKYDVIVIDPPWPMQKIERDERPNQVDFDYPTMSESELAALEIPAAENCHLWLWTTHKFLPMAFRLLKEWNFRYVCTFVWHKPGGFQPIGLPQYNCEFALYARKGSPEFFDTKAFPVCFDAPRGKHSEKPEEFYEVLCRTTNGKRIDMFNRRAIDGFEAWGNEAV